MRLRPILSMLLCLAAFGGGIADAVVVEWGAYRLADWCATWSSPEGSRSEVCVLTYTSVYGWSPGAHYSSVAHRPFAVSHVLTTPNGSRTERTDYKPVVADFFEIADDTLHFRGTMKGCAVELTLVAEPTVPFADVPRVTHEPGRSRVDVGAGSSKTTRGLGHVCDDPSVAGPTEGSLYSQALAGATLR